MASVDTLKIEVMTEFKFVDSFGNEIEFKELKKIAEIFDDKIKVTIKDTEQYNG